MFTIVLDFIEFRVMFYNGLILHRVQSYVL